MLGDLWTSYNNCSKTEILSFCKLRCCFSEVKFATEVLDGGIVELGKLFATGESLREAGLNFYV